MPRLSTLRVRLIAMLTAVVAVAMGVVFLYVVPSLRDQLITTRFDRLEAAARAVQSNRGLFRPIISPNAKPNTPQIQRVGLLANARVTVFRVVDGKLVSLDPSSILGIDANNRAVRRVLQGNDVVQSRSPRGDLVVAFKLPKNADPPTTIVALSQQVRDIDSTADFVERRILVATGLALLVACLVGWGAAYAASRRLARLERAATRISVGEFGKAIGDQSSDELGELARAFDTMQHRLEQADRSRKDFIANASHELRTPLFTLGGFLELLDDEDLDQSQRDMFLREMRDQVLRLGKLATDLLDLSRLDAGAVAVQREPIDLTATAAGLVREFRGLAAGQGSRVVLVRPPSPVPHAIADELRVQQIGRALVDNAIRHTPRGTEVRISVVPQDGIVQLAVTDNGPGVDEEAGSQLFDRFYRADGGSAAGSGLGLAIARELAERMDGSLELGSPGGPTTFTLSLPAEREPNPTD
jgi:signal transduction histidine kinase